MENKLLISSWIKKDGKLVFVSKQDEARFKELSKGLREGQKVMFTVDFNPDDGRLSQIAHVHKLIGDMAEYSGDEFASVKREVKKRAGLYNADGTLKSFASCSMSELEKGVRSAIELGKFIGMILK